MNPDEKRRLNQLSNQIATEIMGISTRELGDSGHFENLPFGCKPIPKFAEDWGATFQLIQKMRDDGYVLEMMDRRIFHNSYRDSYVAFVDNRHSAVYDTINSEVQPELVCRAALKAKGLNHILYQRATAKYE